MIIWTTAGLFSLVESEYPEYVTITARSAEEIESLKQTLRLVDLWDDGVIDVDLNTDPCKIDLRKEDAVEWFGFELDWWIDIDLGHQFVRGGAVKQAIALEKLMMALEGGSND